MVGWNQHGFPNQMSCSGEIQEISDQITFLWNGFHTKLLSQSNQIHMLWLFWSKLCSKVLSKISDPSFTELRQPHHPHLLPLCCPLQQHLDPLLQGQGQGGSRQGWKKNFLPLSRLISTDMSVWRQRNEMRSIR